jgi:hypothetical protein
MRKSISLYSGIALHKTRETLLPMWTLPHPHGLDSANKKAARGEPMRLLAKQEAD